METLKTIIKNLTRKDVYLLRNVLKRKVNGCSGMRIRLFDLVRKNKGNTDAEAAMLLYRTKPNSAFCHLKKRLKDDLLNFLFTNNLFEQNSHDQCTLAKSGFYRSLLFVRFYSSKNILQEVSALQQSMEEIAGRHEFLLEKLVLLEQKYLRQKEYEKTEDPENIVQCIDEQYMNFRLVFMARVYCNKLLYFTSGCGQYTFNDIGKTLECIENLKLLFETQRLSTAGFWYFFLCSLYNVIFNDRKKALKLAVRALKEVLDNREKFAGENLAIIKKHLAILYLQEGDTASCRKHLKQPAVVSAVGYMVQLDVAELFVQLCFYENNAGAAEETIGQELQRYKNTRNQQALHKWHYYQACLEFSKGNHKYSLTLLSGSKESSRKNNATFLPGHRLLEMLNLVELQKYDLLEYKLGAYKQMLKRIKTIVPHRYKLIGKLLEELMKTGYMFTETAANQQAEIRNLTINKGFYRWELHHYEMIRFDKWFISKLKQAKKLKIPAITF